MMAQTNATWADGKIFNAAEGGVWRHDIIGAAEYWGGALAAGKVFNAAEGSIRRHKIYGSC